MRKFVPMVVEAITCPFPLTESNELVRPVKARLVVVALVLVAFVA